MKKLNRKGFTLIELLAVIVVLAIVLVVTIPSVISSMNSARTSQLKNATNTATKWFTEQYEIDVMGSVAGTPDSAYSEFFKEKKLSSATSEANAIEISKGNDVLVAAGISNPAGTSGKVFLNGNKVCVILIADSDSQFYNASNTDSNTARGNGCPKVENSNSESGS